MESRSASRWRTEGLCLRTICQRRCFLGLETRHAVKTMQVKYGLPADSYATPELLARLRTGH